MFDMKLIIQYLHQLCSSAMLFSFGPIKTTAQSLCDAARQRGGGEGTLRYIFFQEKQAAIF